jgi:uncharacterized protein YqgC (DUF456 family)
MLVGLFGLIVPIFPGTVIMWLASLGYGLVAGFDRLGWAMFIPITVLMLISTALDNLFMGAGARKGGASWSTIFVAILAGVVGTIAFPPFGGFIAAPLAVFLLEYVRLRDVQKAWQALRGLATGLGLSFIARFGVGVVILLLWLIWVWKG